MADSPRRKKGTSTVLKLVIACADVVIPDAYGVVSVDVQLAVNRIAMARIVLRDGDMADGDFKISDSEHFLPGNSISVCAGYGSEVHPIFEGIIVRHAVKIDGDNHSTVQVECKHAAFALTLAKKNANFIDLKDEEIIRQLLGQLAGNVGKTDTKHKEITQYYASDWDFILTRAEANGLLAIPTLKKIDVVAPQTQQKEVLSLTYGVDMMSFEADMDARTQFSEVLAVSWDPGSQDVVEQTAAQQELYAQGDISAQKLAEVGAAGTYRLQTVAPHQSTELTAWARARQMKAELARIRGRASFQGNEKACPGAMISLAKVGRRFSGKVFISAVRHRIHDGNWISEVEFGMPDEWFAERYLAQGEGTAAGLLPAASGLQVGVVEKLDADPAGQYRIQVSIPVLQAKTPGIWARLASFYGSSAVGAFFIPEVGDEVVIGYFNNDPSCPVVLGSLYSSQKAMPHEPTAENYIKALWTKGLLKIEFDDENKVITVITPQKNTIELSDEGKSICLTDQNNNKIEMNSSGISLSSPKDVVIDAKGKISISAVGAIDCSSQSDLTGSGLNLNLSAQIGLTAKGNATAELSASGQTTVKGALVMIN